MKSPRFLLFPLVLLLCSVWLVPEAVHSASDDWLPVDPADLAMKNSVVEKDADAEAIFWQVRVADEIDGGTPRTVLRHYIRVKVFTDRGREAQSKIEIPYLSRTEIKDIAARTIKPDGSIVELKKEDVFEKTIVKKSGLKLKAKSFAMPAVEPGAVIEYRWREIRKDNLTNYDSFDLQRDIPVRLVKYFLKPVNLTYSNFGMNYRSFHCNTTPFVKEKDGYYSTTMSNVPAFHEEPRMPPERELRAWMLVFYTDQENLPPEKLWPKRGKELYEVYKSSIKVNDEVKKVAAETVGDTAAPDEKLHRLFDFCRTKIRNVNDDASGLTPEERAKMKENKSSSDTLKRGFGTGEDIDLLFAALATAAGFEVHVTNTADRGRTFFNSRSTDAFLLNTYNIAVKVGDQWRFFDPASKYVPYGMLRWQEEGVETLVTDPKNSVFVTTPLSEPDKSKEKRTAKLKLSEDGTLEGDVRVEYTGHVAAETKEDLDDESPQQREDSLKDEIKASMSTAELTDIKIENVTDPEKPFAYSFHLRVPGYAQRTGKRLFLQPAVFQHGKEAMFTTAERKYPVYFSYPWSEEDEVRIELPEGFMLDNPDAPQPFSAGSISEYKLALAVTSDKKTLISKRTFYFGGGGNILYRAENYSQLKALFDNLHQADNHTITLKQATTASASPE